MGIFKILTSAALAVLLYQSIGLGIDLAVAAQNPPPDRSPLPGESRGEGRR